MGNAKIANDEKAEIMDKKDEKGSAERKSTWGWTTPNWADKEFDF